MKRTSRVSKLRAAKPTEFNQGGTYERYSGEHARARVTAEGAALGGTAAGLSAAGTGLTGAKWAGTKAGQHTLGALHTNLKATGHPLADTVARAQRYGLKAAKHKPLVSAGIAASSLGAGAAGLGARWRSNEEAGISQGIGRMKAGEQYSGAKARVTASKSLSSAAAMLSDVDWSSPKVKRAADFVRTNRRKIAGGALVATGATGATTAGVVGVRHARSRDQLKSELTKGGHAFLATGLATGLGGAGASQALHHAGHKEEAKEALAGTVGGWAGQGVYQAAGYGMKHKAIRREHQAGLTRSQKDKALKPVKREHGAFTTEMYRHYPMTLANSRKPMPGANINRITGYTHRGKLGTAIGTVSTAAGSLATVNAVGRKHRHKEELAKALYGAEQRTSPLRAAEMAAGIGLGAWGLGRSGMLGAALSRGIKAARTKNSTQALQALQMAQAAQGVLARGTAPAERALRQVRAIDHAVRAVPAAIRPEVATAAGILLAARAHPVRHTDYYPVATPSARINVRSSW